MSIATDSRGSAPLGFQWYKDGNLAPNLTNGWPVFTNVQRSAAGSYFAVVSNAFGVVTSAKTMRQMQFALKYNF